jgi:DNA-binding FadR family transcriptional regulator
MPGQESYMNRILSIRCELCRLADRLEACHDEDREFYEDIAKQYANRLKLLQAKCLLEHNSMSCILSDHPRS